MQSYSKESTPCKTRGRSRSSSMFVLVVLILIVWTMTGCSSLSVTGNIPPHLLNECPDLPEPAGGKSSDLLLHVVQVYGEYHECRGKHAALSTIVKED